MNKNWIKKCFEIDNGIRLVEINLDISKSYLEQAENTLKRIDYLISQKDFLWASVMIYYCSYYSIYAFLQRIGVKSENHSCSIELFKFLIENEQLNSNLELFRKQRVDAQYYLKFVDEEKHLQNYNLVKDFYLTLLDIYDNAQINLNEYKSKIDLLINQKK